MRERSERVISFFSEGKPLGRNSTPPQPLPLEAPYQDPATGELLDSRWKFVEYHRSRYQREKKKKKEGGV
jgi:hypothetical protein